MINDENGRYTSKLSTLDKVQKFICKRYKKVTITSRYEYTTQDSFG